MEFVGEFLGPPIPLITRQTVSRTNVIGTTATLTVSATGPNLSYQWRNGGSTLTKGGNTFGAGTPTLTLTNMQPADAAGYDLVVSNDYGMVVSQVATLTGVQPPAVAGVVTGILATATSEN